MYNIGHATVRRAHVRQQDEELKVLKELDNHYSLHAASRKPERAPRITVITTRTISTTYRCSRLLKRGSVVGSDIVSAHFPYEVNYRSQLILGRSYITRADTDLWNPSALLYPRTKWSVACNYSNEPLRQRPQRGWEINIYVKGAHRTQRSGGR